MGLCYAYHWTPADVWRLTTREVAAAIEYVERVNSGN